MRVEAYGSVAARHGLPLQFGEQPAGEAEAAGVRVHPHMPDLDFRQRCWGR